MSRFFGNQAKDKLSLSALLKMLMIICLWVVFQPYLLWAEDGYKTNLEANESYKIEEIKVTAQKHEENVQEVPISISVFNNQAVEDKKIESLFDIADFVPSLTMITNGSSGRSTPSMRGLNAPGESLTVTTGLYIDGVPVLSVLGYQDQILDIERVEVLRGPQSTLYGKNTEAGVINIITREPNNEFKSKISVEGNKYLSSETGDGLGGSFSALVSGPIFEDRLFASFSGKFDKQEGFIKNISNGDTANDREHYYGRGTIGWKPSDRLSMSLIFAYTEFDDGGMNMGLSELGASMFGIPYYGSRKEASNYESPDKSTNSTQSLKFTYNFSDKLQLTSVTSRRVYEDKKKSDFDFSTMNIWHSDLDSTYQKITQELRLNYEKNKLKWLVGLFYDNDDDDTFSQVFSDNPRMAKIRDRDFTGSSYAVFTNLSYPLFRSLNLVTGLRYENQNKEFKDNVNNLEGDESWDSITPKLALEYFFSPSIMSYISATKGYRSGGFNQFAMNPLYYSYDEEELLSYELGVKSALMDNRLIANAAVYFMDIKDMQVNEAVSPVEAYVTNAAEASGIGFELDITARLISGLSLIAGLGYNHIEFDEFADAGGDYKGKMAPYAPEYTFNIGAAYRNHNGFYLRADLIGYGKMYLDYANKYDRDAYQTVNGKIGYETEHFDIYFYGKNIFDEKYDMEGYSGGFYTLYSEPGEIGLQLNYRF